MDAKTSAPESRCAACRAAFSCGMKTGEEPCWCAALPAIEPTPGRGCLCPRCLTGRVNSTKS
ncbi:MAG: cysteine-rich CWC family protein [Burkholderiales bacterium]